MNNIRQSIRQKRKQLANIYKEEASQAIAANAVLNQIFKQYPSTEHIGAYLALNEEINLKHIICKLWHKGIKVYCPIIHPFKKRHIFFIEYTANTKLIKDKYGIFTPIFDSSKIIAPWELDIALTPLVGFDYSGNRIGMGAGFYDTSFAFRTLDAKFKTPLIGCAFDCQYYANIQRNEWDQKLDAILTESGIQFFE